MKTINRTLVDYSVSIIPVSIVDGGAAMDEPRTVRFCSEKVIPETEIRKKISMEVDTDFIIREIGYEIAQYSMALSKFREIAVRKEVSHE